MKKVEKTMESYNEIAESYCQKTSEGGDRELQERIIDKTVKMVRSRTKGEAPGKPRMIDLGCGDGRDTSYLKNKGMDVVGIDLSISMIQLARRKYPDCSFIHGDMRDTVFPDDTFHGAWASASIINLPKSELSSLESEVFRILDRNGIFTFSFKKGQGEGFEEEGVIDGHPRYFAYYTLQELRERFSLFEIIDSEECTEEIFGSKFVYCWAEPMKHKK